MLTRLSRLFVCLKQSKYFCAFMTHQDSSLTEIRLQLDFYANGYNKLNSKSRLLKIKKLKIFQAVKKLVDDMKIYKNILKSKSMRKAKKNIEKFKKNYIKP